MAGITNRNFFEYAMLREFFLYMKKNYEVTSLRDWNGSNQIILRFDIDFDIGIAYKMAQLLKEIGIRPSFFVQTSCPFYNPLAEKNRRMLAEMSKEGFEIGLHFNPSIYPEFKANE